MNELALFAGAGGGILGGKLLGWRTVCAVEYDEHARNVLVARQNDGSIKPFPIWDDITTFNGKPWKKIVNVVSGGFPCQDISSAGRGEGISGERSGLWGEMARVVCEVRPKYVFVENSPMLTIRGLDIVLRDLAKMGYNARWGVLGGGHFKDSPILRERIWILASTLQIKRNAIEVQAKTDYESGKQWSSNMSAIPMEMFGNRYCGIPDITRMGDGMAIELDKLERIGNGQVPALVRLAWNTLIQGFDDGRKNNEIK